MKVLVIDADKFTRVLLESELHQENIEVLLTSDGEEGLAKIKTFKPDVVILDLIIPKKDGFEVLEALQKSGDAKKSKIIVFSSLNQPSDKDEARKLGAQAFYAKGEHTARQVIDAMRSPIVST